MKLQAYIAALHAALLAILLAVSPASSGSMALLGAGGAGAAVGGASLTYVSSAVSGASSGNPINYGTLSYGSGCTRVIVATSWINGSVNPVAGITVGGVSLVQVSGAFASNGTSFSTNTDVWESSAGLAGTSGTVIVDYTTGIGYFSTVAVYCLVTTTPTASASIVAHPGSSPVSASIVVPSGGVALMVSSEGTAGSSASFTNATVDVDVTASPNNNYYGHTTSTGTVLVTATYTGGTNTPVMSLVSWAP